jgi:hypothetical protein
MDGILRDVEYRRLGDDMFFAFFPERNFYHRVEFFHVHRVGAVEVQELVEIVCMRIGHHQVWFGDAVPEHGKILLSHFRMLVAEKHHPVAEFSRDNRVFEEILSVFIFGHIILFLPEFDSRDAGFFHAVSHCPEISLACIHLEYR